MSPFQGFSEASRLYVENFEVVRTVEQAYGRDADELVAAFEQGLATSLAPLAFCSYRPKNSAYAYWWAGECDRSEAVTLWFRVRNVHSISPEQMRLFVEVPSLPPEVNAQLHHVATSELGLTETGASSGATLQLDVPLVNAPPLTEALARLTHALRGLAKFHRR